MTTCARLSTTRPATLLCPVATLAEDATATWRLRRRLQRDTPTADAALLERLDDRAEGATAEDLLGACRARLDATRDLAAQLRATSTKGAIFQLYLLAARLSEFDDAVASRSELPEAVLRRFDGWREELRRLLYSATACIEGTALDPDLQFLREQMQSPEFDVTAELEELAHCGRASRV